MQESYILIQRPLNDGFLTKKSVAIRRQRARELYSDTKTFEPYYDGCTYVSLEDAMLTQKDVGSEQLVKMTWDADNSIRGDNVQLVKRNWPKNILMCQKFDVDDYGTIFPILPSLSRCPVDTKLLWICYFSPRVGA